jgi:hypothetical protein
MTFRKSILLIALITIPATGCMRKKEISGKEYVPRDVLVDVLVDIHLVDGITNDRKFYRRFSDVDSVDLLGPVFEKYGIDYQMFRVTMDEYTRHPPLLDQVYNDVLMKLNVMLDENENEEEQDQ